MKIGKIMAASILASALLVGVQGQPASAAKSCYEDNQKAKGKFNTDKKWQWVVTVCVPEKLTIGIWYPDGSAATNVKIKSSDTGKEYDLGTFSGSNNNLTFKLPEYASYWQISVQSDERGTNTKGQLTATGS
ncbi:MAG TPA: hypothetical protein VNM69_21445 [Bacillus sp. (in: firmicutes)]|uniref:hypothetical protein n=1 Tax=Paenibacillus ehimensis TaxID=79264 RepID=UPI002CB4C941|nr:hypothetical protein [Paenibacillus ehimensis]MEC0209782.1 hypothetical protein [Paenibacillus ehimensis]HWO78438.1 hypothetical protein [Bacillus sp. (in: firmicutes)]